MIFVAPRNNIRINPMDKKKIVLIGGGVGSSTFTKAVKDFPVELATIVSTFDDGGSTGAIRRDYGGIALGDFRQCVLASLDLHSDLLKTLNHRFGSGGLWGVNIGNLVIKAFLAQYPNERAGVAQIHKLFGLKNSVLPVSYDFAKLCATLSDKRVLSDQHQIASYLSFYEAPIKSLFLSKPAKINPDARKAILNADYLAFSPGHFFTSVLPHLYVSGFKEAWKKSGAKKIWFVNLLAHKGQDSPYALRDYLSWFERTLGPRPFDLVVINKKVDNMVLRRVKDRFEKVKVSNADLKYLKGKKVATRFADLTSPVIRAQQENDPVPRAPLRHDPEKIKKFFQDLLANRPTYRS